MLGVLISGELEEFDVTAEVGEDVIGLGVSEVEFKIWDSRKTPGGAMFTWELQGEPELKDLRLGFKSFVIFTAVGGCETRYAHAPTFMVLADALTEKIPGLGDLERLVGSLVLSLLFVPQLTPDKWVSTFINRRT